MPYEGSRPIPAPTPEELRARIPGWGADLAPEHRRTWQQLEDVGDTGAHWDLPERQGPDRGRERSIEHGMLPPVWGTAQPLHGLSGAIRRVAYDRFSETKNTRWLLLVLGDRVDAVTAHARSLLTRRPDDPITQTGVLAEPQHRPLASRFGRGRIDLRHTWLDPIIVVGPWVLTVVLSVRALRRLGRRH
ncbi:MULTISPECIES: hypothetical protein [Microbacterium]|uniref:Uncharacterized protein n=1 Tax=Microbacterium paraoxydans TaxID=199592 RepID=A0A1H1X0S9_9MICO|nr:MULTISPECIES: hypothetical protein [Microbacterium]AVL96785.1 hypothetical protein C6C15_06545 [Microbacterium sp. str. 'China']MCK2034441.1 hypothetical protein [Microbacterium sp. KSW4-4]SDT02944.1 hypothetical protein SAMN04489809_3317 [Microbacterium paraoxydans]